MRILIIFMFIFIISGCVSNSNNSNILPKIQYPPDIILIPFEWSWPRILDVVDSEECNNNNNKIIRDNEFWKKCRTNEIDTNSNIYLGLDETNYKLFIQNFNRLISREKQWRSIIDEINRPRIK